MNDKHLSYSQISQYCRCGQQYYYRYIDPAIPVPPGIALIKGKTVHSGIEKNFRQKIDSKIDLPKKEIVDFTVSEYETATTSEEIFLSEEEKTTGKDIVIGKGLDSVVQVAELYSDEVAPTIQPVSVEDRHMIEIPDCRPVVTITDCIDDNKKIHDFKVTGKSKSQSEVDNSLQLTLYALAYNDRTGEMPAGLSFDALVTTKKPKYQILETKRDEFDFVSAIRIIQTVQKGIEAEVFLPAAEGSWVCDPRWCGYYSICKYKNKVSF